ncbi:MULTISPECIES: hypothetical protein [unclassified Planococcus (in: firmicutes)]|uniref:hypothetical protein n=1 Tax=unclassified Planococcus (in: firmicutes) TaxID=2662419 RepID=UPI000C7C45C6|nr:MULTISPECIES: hypothetical protein [unclassified Planococcus (in: firmicutes)]PKG45432.1 hypothetical protein CXF66_12500 [Planococcus sp. Urea-trap-24]PKG88972.1 hypothetical protein CXF91_09035 [Planococcus sp. Urea-3u-39]PKH36340.1 hypothetical protein CXF77_14705 [Planococcus sp. MB-3u-09]
MTDVNYIRQEVNLKRRPYSEVVNQMGLDFQTIKKYADKKDWNEPKQIQRLKARVLGAVKPIIDQWLLDDSKKKKKFQRTAKRMFDQLVKEHNFQGSYRALCEYVSRRKRS